MNKQELKEIISEILKERKTKYLVSYNGKVLYDNESIWNCKLFYKNFIRLYINDFIQGIKELKELKIEMYYISINQCDIEERINR